MEEVQEFLKEEMSASAKRCGLEKDAIAVIAREMFSDKINVTRIAFFLAFTQKVIEFYPHKKREVYEDTYMSLYNNIRFEKEGTI